jgi:hypothetical protein
MPAQQALAISRIEIRRILERICFYDDSFAQKWQIKGFQIAEHRRLQIWEWQNKKQRAQGFQSAISNLKSAIFEPRRYS